MVLAFWTPQQVKCPEALDLVEMRLTRRPQILEGFAFLLNNLETVHGDEHFWLLRGVVLLHPLSIIPISDCVARNSRQLQREFSAETADVFLVTWSVEGACSHHRVGYFCHELGGAVKDPFPTQVLPCSISNTLLHATL